MSPYGVCRTGADAGTVVAGTRWWRGAFARVAPTGIAEVNTAAGDEVNPNHESFAVLVYAA